VANIGKRLRARGWTLYGWKEDRSDSMTDYYDPESWDGVAEKDGFAWCVDVGEWLVERQSGEDQERRIPQKGNTCPECEGGGVKVGAPDFQEARASGGLVSPFSYIRMPPQFHEQDYPPELYGKRRCVRCSGRGWLYGEPKREVVCTWPAFQANPRGRTWHVEKNGQVIASGIGLNDSLE